MSIKIIITEDGSHSLYDEQLNETYHSTRGALGESKHVFIEAGLSHWSSLNQKKEIRILEVGLGTGLNAFLTAEYADKHNLSVQFQSLEPFPIEKEVYEKLKFSNSENEKVLLQKIHESGWENKVEISRNFELNKTTSKLEDFSALAHFNIIYFDAFAPSKQPEVWSQENIYKCYELLESGGILTTYCAQGRFKRNLVAVGFEVETLQGAMGKKEMVRATKK